MKQMTRRLLVSMIGLFFLLAACAPAPAATQNSALGQQLMDQSVALTAAAQNLQAKEQELAQQAAALTVVAQTATAIEQALPTTSPSLPATESGSPNGSDTSEDVLLPSSAPTDTPTITETPGPTATLPLYLTATPALDDCTVSVVKGNSFPTPYSLPARLPQLEKDPINLKPGGYIIIASRVNLRTGPSLVSRILMTLDPDPLATADPNTPNAVATPNQPTLYRVVGGPVYTDLGGSSVVGTAIPKYNVSNRLYKWWQIESLNHLITGWVAEASACGQYYFITPATPAAK
jgi:hypothetical protein